MGCKITHVWLLSIMPMKWKSSKYFCMGHLGHRAPIPLSGVRGHLVEIWGLSAVWLQFPQRRSAEYSVQQFSTISGTFEPKIQFVCPSWFRNYEQYLRWSILCLKAPSLTFVEIFYYLGSSLVHRTRKHVWDVLITVRVRVRYPCPHGNLWVPKQDKHHFLRIP